MKKTTRLFLPILLAAPIALLLPLVTHAAATSTPTYTVTIDAYVDGQPATTATNSANNAAFPMVAFWGALNLGAHGTGDYPLGPTGYNSVNSYEAVTAPMDAGSGYSTREILTNGTPNRNTGVVSNNCTDGQQFMLDGYTTGTSPSAAASGTPSLTYPSFSKLSQNEYVVVWNTACLSAPIASSTPANGATRTSTALTELSWSPVTDAYGPVTYYYESSNSYETSDAKNGGFVNPVYTSGALTSPEIPTPGTPDGTYYWHVKAVDAEGNSSAWSQTMRVNVVN